MKNLVIVESPTKAKTITKFLGKDFKVESSFGHVRDLPQKDLGVDVENNFSPTYVIPAKAAKTVNKLKKLAKDADIIYFATDEDREGEAISWHLAEILKPKPAQIKRIAFHEITKEAIKNAIANPRDIDLNLVDAQQARRILDRVVGYKLSPFLWKKIARGLSAGRVQSVAVRLIVEREREIQKFKSDEYWTVEGIFEKDNQPFGAKLAKVDNKALSKLEIKNEAQAKEILDTLKNSKYHIAEVEQKDVKRSPLPAFTTSTLQQAAIHRLGFSASQTMVLAQQLYEGVQLGDEGFVGLITYMRTDSVNLADKFLNEAKSYIQNKFGEKYSSGFRKYKTKSRNAQEAHEAIRPTEIVRDPESVKEFLDPRQFRLYELIWQRALASQTSDAQLKQTSVDINDQSDKYTFRATGSVIVFPGFLKIFPESAKENLLPELKSGDQVSAREINPFQHFTQPPARYNEATLVKMMEEKGIGRPSTYAPTIATIQARNYVEKEEKKLKPTEIGILVNDLLVEHFQNVVDYQFTAKMENDLDEIAEGNIIWHKVLKEFYQPFEKNLKVKEKELDKKELTETSVDAVCSKCGSPMVIKIGRFGKFLACSAYPKCKNTQKLNNAGGIEETPQTLLSEKCPDCGQPLVKRHGRFGEFTGCSAYPKCKYIKREPSKEYGTCPQCGIGKIVAKHSKRGIFYACDQYPKCKLIINGQPTGEKCPKCGSLMMESKKGVVCSNKECSNH